MRARYPDQEGYVQRDGVNIFYEVYGVGEPTVLLLPTWSVVHSRIWKAQIPYLARHCRVLTFDGRGNGKSSRPMTSEFYTDNEFAADALAVMDATATQQAVLVATSAGTFWSLLLATEHPERVAGAVFLGAAFPSLPFHPHREVYSFDDVLDTDEGWAKDNRHYWLKDYRGFLEFFMSQVFTEPHSTKQIEDDVEFGLETTPEVLLVIGEAPLAVNEETVEEFARRVRCPVLVIHGDEDNISPHTHAVRLAQVTDGTLVTIKGGGHAPQGRDPVKVNLLLRDFIKPSIAHTVTWQRARNRRKRVLYISSPIGLGHVRRDVAIADELRRLRPDLEIDWLAQHPVTEVLRARGERIHPASIHLANESQHFENEAAEHDLHCFQAFRRMDEILLANYMLFHDVVNDEPYDLWIGDEAWELDYYLHENPEEKHAAYVWLTDFVGFLPMPDGGEREAFFAADYNAEMIEQIERYPRLRDRAIFVGNPDDIVPDTFGPGLPVIRAWTERHYDFSGYITGFDPAVFTDREAMRAELGYASDEKVCMVAVGGSGVGHHLLRRVMTAFPEAKQLVPELRMIVVAGPRIDPQSLPTVHGIEVHGYVHELYRHLAVCDLAVVQGGLATTMELTANKRPFLYFPLRHHFEQNFHVRHRLTRYHAGRYMDFEQAAPEVIAAAIVEEIGRKVAYREVEHDGAKRAAAQIAELI